MIQLCGKIDGFLCSVEVLAFPLIEQRALDEWGTRPVLRDGAKHALDAQTADGVIRTFTSSYRHHRSPKARDRWHPHLGSDELPRPGPPAIPLIEQRARSMNGAREEQFPSFQVDKFTLALSHFGRAGPEGPLIGAAVFSSLKAATPSFGRHSFIGSFRGRS